MNISFSYGKNKMCMAAAPALANNMFMYGIGSKLRERARELGMSDAKVAKTAGLSARRYGHYVTEDREPNFDTLLKICGALQCTPDFLFGLANRPRQPAAPNVICEGKNGRMLFRAVLNEIFAAHEDAGVDTPLDDVVMEAVDEARSILRKFPDPADRQREIASVRSVYRRLLERDQEQTAQIERNSGESDVGTS